MVEIDQIVGGVGEECLTAMRTGPARRRVSWRDELRRHLSRGSEGGIIEHGEVLIDRATGRLGFRSLRSFDALLSACIGFDQAGIDGKALTADQALIHAAAQDCLEQTAHQVAFAEAPMTVLGEGGVVGNVCVQAKATEPPIGQIEMDLLAQPAFRADVRDNRLVHALPGIEERPFSARYEACLQCVGKNRSTAQS